MDPRIAVVMSTHNRRNEVLHSLEHLTRLPEQPQLVLVDNASTDDTLTAVAHCFPHVQIIAAGGNTGQYMRVADQPFLAFPTTIPNHLTSVKPALMGSVFASFWMHP